MCRLSNSTQSHCIDRIVENHWYEEYLCSIIAALRECKVDDITVITIVNRTSSRLNKLNDPLIPSVIYQLLLLANDSRSRPPLTGKRSRRLSSSPSS